MRIRLDLVREEPYRWREVRTVSPDALERPELLGLSEIEWQGEVDHAPPGYRVRARYAYEQALSCTRCLAPLSEPVEGDVELLVVVGESGTTAGEHELEERDLGVLTVHEAALETDPILLEQLQLNVPMRVLCKDDCAGLCPTCGADRNVGPCACGEPAADPRWAALATWKGRKGP